MNLIDIGDLVNTHGLKGEVRILSDFKYKDEIFKVGNHLYIGKNKDDLIIKTYRKHKNYDMVTFEGINDIEDVIIYKGDVVYIDKDKLDIDGYLDEDLIGFSVYQNDKKVGVINSLKKSKLYTLLVVSNNNKEYLIPNTTKFVLSVDLENKKIYIIDMLGLVDED